MSRTSKCLDEYGHYGENNGPIRDMTEEERKASIERDKANSVVSKAMITDEPDDYEIPLEGYEAALGNDLVALQSRVKELEAENAQLKAMIADQINSTGDDPEIMVASRAEWAARAKAAEAKLTGGQKDD